MVDVKGEQQRFQIPEADPQAQKAMGAIKHKRDEILGKYPHAFDKREPDEQHQGDDWAFRFTPILREYVHERPIYYSLVTGELFHLPDKGLSRRPDLTKERQPATAEEWVELQEKVLQELITAELLEEEKIPAVKA